MMARFRIYIAVSLDGFIAGADGGVDWLRPFEANDYGYNEFIAGIGTTVMGRATYDQALGFGTWPYERIQSYVLTSRPVPSLAPDTQTWPAGPAALAARLREDAKRDVWIAGGARTIDSFLRIGAVDLMELFIMPVTLGAGIRLFESTPPLSWELAGGEACAGGAVKLTYRRAP